jgi:hypothetical protein
LYPLIELLERVALRFEREESSPPKLNKLEGFLVQYGLPLAEAMPLFSALLSLAAREESHIHIILISRTSWLSILWQP